MNVVLTLCSFGLVFIASLLIFVLATYKQKEIICNKTGIKIKSNVHLSFLKLKMTFNLK